MYTFKRTYWRACPGLTKHGDQHQLHNCTAEWKLELITSILSPRPVNHPLLCNSVQPLQVNQLSQTLFGSRLLPHLNQPSHTHEEYFGLEYLYKQTEGLSLSLEEGEEDDDDANSVDGFVDKSTDTLPSDYLMTIGVGVCEEEERRDRSDTQQVCLVHTVQISSSHYMITAPGSQQYYYNSNTK